MNKKIIYILLILIILVGAVLTATLKLNLDTEYAENTKIYVYIGKTFDSKEIKQIAEEVFASKAIVQKVEVYEDMACITLPKQNTENINEKVEELNNKINEKYGITNKTEEISVQNEPEVEIYTIIKPYILPIAIATIAVLIYSAIVFKKLGIIKTVVAYLLAILSSQALYISILLVARIPFSTLIIPIGLIIYVLAIIIVTTIKQLQKNKLNEN